MPRNLNEIENSLVGLQKPQQNCTFMNSASDLGTSKSTVQCAAHVCTLFSSTANLRGSYGSQVYQGMQSSREETWVGPSVTAR
jgi:hypothetical protein